ncbi:AAA family ATPase [Luteococcus sp.]|uniref:AAA family ATPase n=1 Tax=Luteococcus sp. TaxID=1969402 RepID=UPI0037352193
MLIPNGCRAFLTHEQMLAELAVEDTTSRIWVPHDDVERLLAAAEACDQLATHEATWAALQARALARLRNPELRVLDIEAPHDPEQLRDAAEAYLAAACFDGYLLHRPVHVNPEREPSFRLELAHRPVLQSSERTGQVCVEQQTSVISSAARDDWRVEQHLRHMRSAVFTWVPDTELSEQMINHGYVPATGEMVLFLAELNARREQIAVDGRGQRYRIGARRVVSDTAPNALDGLPRKAGGVARTSNGNLRRVEIPVDPISCYVDLASPLAPSRRVGSVNDGVHWKWASVHEFHDDPYDQDAAAKIVLPDTHRRMLNTLASTRGLNLVCDVVEGKSAGSVILCKGEPGIGKTLTAEIYAEIIGRPLLKVLSRDLGTTAASVDDALGRLLEFANRLDLVLLLDECDVYLRARGNDLDQNAVVSEFLRRLEYFDGLLFLTTNRPYDIDDAVMQRAAAIIDYQRPDRDGLRQVWELMSATQHADLSPQTITAVLDALPDITPRDIKHAVAGAIRQTHLTQTPITLTTILDVAAWRGLTPAPNFHQSPNH